MVESLIKFTNTKFYRSIIASAFAAGLLYLVCGFSFFVFDWVAKLAGLEEPAWAASTRSTLQIVLTILAGVLGFISGSGVLNNTFLGKFFYYAGRTALARGLFGQFLVFALIYFPMREVRTIPQINEGLPATGEAGMVLGGLLSVLGFLFFNLTYSISLRILGLHVHPCDDSHGSLFSSDVSREVWVLPSLSVFSSLNRLTVEKILSVKISE